MNEISQTALGSNNNQVVNIYPPNGDKHPLSSAMESIMKSIEDDPDFKGFIEDLLNYMKPRTVIGLEGKLQQTNFKKENLEELLADAIDLKEKFAKKLEKEQLSFTAQHCYAHILAYIKSIFISKIKPLLIQGQSVAEIESAIYSEIVLNIYNQTSAHLPGLTTDHIAGMLYYLTGKCHLSWKV
jgi:hypothetical protein